MKAVSCSEVFLKENNFSSSTVLDEKLELAKCKIHRHSKYVLHVWSGSIYVQKRILPTEKNTRNEQALHVNFILNLFWNVKLVMQRNYILFNI